jgi:hypothetical protein
MNGSTDSDGAAGFLTDFANERLLEAVADLNAPSGEAQDTDV